VAKRADALSARFLSDQFHLRRPAREGNNAIWLSPPRSAVRGARMCLPFEGTGRKRLLEMQESFSPSARLLFFVERFAPTRDGSLRFARGFPRWRTLFQVRIGLIVAWRHWSG